MRAYKCFEGLGTLWYKRVNRTGLVGSLSSRIHGYGHSSSCIIKFERKNILQAAISIKLYRYCKLKTKFPAEQDLRAAKIIIPTRHHRVMAESRVIQL